MNQIQKKQHSEKYYFEELLRLIPTLEVEYDGSLEPPFPDVLAKAADRKIAVEVTKWVDCAGKARESEQDAIVREAQTRYEKMQTVPVKVSVHWSSHPSSLRKQRFELASAIAGMVSENINDGRLRIDLGWDQFPSDFPDCIARISIYDLRAVGRNLWNSPRAGFVPTLSLGQVEEMIAKKNAKISNYRAFSGEIWLLIAHEGLGPSSFCALSEDAKAATYQSDFDRIFIISSMPHQAIELQTSHKAKK